MLRRSEMLLVYQSSRNFSGAALAALDRKPAGAWRLSHRAEMV
jgi:hypothetical protein